MALDDQSSPFRLGEGTAALIAEVRPKHMRDGDGSWDGTHRRVARALFHDDPKRAELLYAQLSSSRACPAGRVLAGAGSGLDVTWWNCFISPLLQDSMRTDELKPGRGIMEALANVAYSMQAGGGVGTDFSPLRPKGALVSRLMTSASGPIAFMHMWDAMCRTVMSAGHRRGAMMATIRCDHPDVLDVITEKRTEGSLTMFNVSVLVTDAFMRAKERDEEWELGHPAPPFRREDALAVREWENPNTGINEPWYVYRRVRARELWEAILRSTYVHAEPGVIFIDRVNEWNNLWYAERVQCTNPCVTGDTLIAVAGRGPVSIAQLEREGKDFPVFACDTSSGEIVVRWARNPRRTRRDVRVLKVMLDDGSFVRCTEDHTFPTRDGRKVAAKDLGAGTSLYRYDAVNGKQDGWRIGLDKRLEYHLIAESKYKIKFDWGRRSGQHNVHHVDENHFNNAWENVEVRTVNDHSSHHRLGDRNPMRGAWWDKLPEDEKIAYRAKMSELASGDNNGMFGKTHRESTKALIGEKSRARYATPEARRAHGDRIKGSMSAEGRARIAAVRSRDMRTFALTCQGCGVIFEVRASAPDHGAAKRRYCSQPCATAHPNRTYSMSEEAKAKISAALRGRPHSVDHTAKVAESRRTGAFRAGSGSNHKVIAVIPDGIEDVYNVTVDEHHNYAVVTSEILPNGRRNHRYSGVFVCNCGEQAMAPDDNCNLFHVNLSRCVRGTPFTDSCEVDYAAIDEIVDLLVRAADNVVDLSPAPTEAQRAAAVKKRRVGLGITGLANLLMFLRQCYGSTEALNTVGRVMRAIRDRAYQTSIELAKERAPFPAFDVGPYLDGKFIRALPDNLRAGIERDGIRNALLLTIAPTGTVSITQADNASGGIEPVFAARYERRVLQPDGSFKTSLVEDLGFRVYANVLFGGDLDAALAKPLPDYMVTTRDLGVEDHLQMLARAQLYVDNSISKTINVPTEMSFEEFGAVYDRAYELGCKSCTTYRPDPSSGRGAVLIEVPSTPTATPSPLEPRRRPEMLDGRTYRLRWSALPYPMFVTINDEVLEDGSRVPFEVFINSKAVDYSHWVAALTRMISAVLRRGGDLTFLPEELKQVYSARGGEWIDRQYVPSEVALIGLTLERHFREIGYLQGSTSSIETDASVEPVGASFAELGRQCRACGQPTVVRQEGCDKCISCGWSNCG